MGDSVDVVLGSYSQRFVLCYSCIGPNKLECWPLAYWASFVGYKENEALSKQPKVLK